MNTYVDSELLNKMVLMLGGEANESGGLIGCSSRGVIDAFYYDEGVSCTANSYYPNLDKLQRELTEWSDNDISFVGIIHSHKSECVLSGKDIFMALQILKINEDLKLILMPIYIQNSKRIIWYSIDKITERPIEIEVVVINSA